MTSSTGSYGIFGTRWDGNDGVVVGVDIGSQNSGAAFVYFSKGARPMVHRVAEWPGQEAINWQSKIPTVLWYDANMRPLSIGAEALLPGVQEEAVGQGWSRAMNFKLQPPAKGVGSQMDLWLDDPSPQAGASLRQVYSDYLKYLLLHTKSAFRNRVLDGGRIWLSLAPIRELVITHPSGWGSREQALLRLAAVEAGCTHRNQASTNIKFLTEAEAAIYFYVHHAGSNLEGRVRAGTNFIVCDIGDSTTVTTVCTVDSPFPGLKMKGSCTSTCIRAGSKVIDLGLEQYLRRVFTAAGVPGDSTEEYIKSAAQDFEEATKYRFGDIDMDYRINLGDSRHLTNPALHIRRGIMTLPGSVVKSFFDPCVQVVLESIGRHVQEIHAPYILLLGEFGDSPYLRQELRNRYEPQGCHILQANDSTSKAYAFGALIWSTIQASPSSDSPNQTDKIKEFYDPCLGRSYGFETSMPYDPTSANHEGRLIRILPSGIKVAQGRWEQFIPKDKPLDQNTVIKKPIALTFPAPRPEPSVFRLTLYSYSGDEEPSWMRNEQGDLLEGFQELLPITIDLTKLAGALEPRIDAYGVVNWHIVFNICLRCQVGGFQAEVEWQEQEAIQTISITTGAQGP